MNKKFLFLLVGALVIVSVSLFSIAAITRGDLSPSGNIVNLSIDNSNIFGLCFNSTTWIVNNNYSADPRIYVFDVDGNQLYNFSKGGNELGLGCDNSYLYTFFSGSGTYRYFYNGTNTQGTGPFLDSEELEFTYLGEDFASAGDYIFVLDVDTDYLYLGVLNHGEPSYIIKLNKTDGSGTTRINITTTNSSENLYSVINGMTIVGNYFLFTGERLVYGYNDYTIHYQNGTLYDSGFNNSQISDGINLESNNTILFTMEGDGIVYALEMNTLEISISYPETIYYSNNESMELNFSYQNTTALDTMWYYVLNSTGGIEVSNTTISDFQNTTFNISSDGVYTMYLYVNNTYGQEDYDSVEFGVSTVGPAIILNSPTSNQKFSSGDNIYFNFTATDSDGLDTCQLWSDFSGNWSINYTWSGPTSGVMNYTQINLTEGTYKYNVWCNDSLGASSYALSNKTFIVDESEPSILINSISTTAGSLITGFSATITDATLSSCKYSVYDENGTIDGTTENVSFICTSGSPKSEVFLVSAYGTYTLVIYASDEVGYSNYTNQSFTVSPSSPPSGGGGGTTTPTEQPEVTFCGDGVCQDGKDGRINRGEDFYNCPSDCAVSFDGLSLDNILFNCFSKDEALKEECIWKTNSGLVWIFYIMAGIFVIAIFVDSSKKKKSRLYKTSSSNKSKLPSWAKKFLK